MVAAAARGWDDNVGHRDGLQGVAFPFGNAMRRLCAILKIFYVFGILPEIKSKTFRETGQLLSEPDRRYK